MLRCGLLFASGCVALGCASERIEPRPPQPRPQQAQPVVYVVGDDGTLERRDDAGGWVRACTGRCGEPVPSVGTYRVRGALATTEPFSLPPPDLGRVVLRFDDDGHVWTQETPRGPRQPNPFVPSFVVFLR